MASENKIAKPKKITVRFFLQTAVSPYECSEITADGTEIPYHPLYAYVTFNRKNMQFRSYYAMYYKSMSEVELEAPGLMAFEERLIKQAILYESSFLSDQNKYSLKGFNNRYDIYATSLFVAIEMYLKPKMRLAILATNNVLCKAFDLSKRREDVGRNLVLLLFELANKVFKGFSDGLKKDFHSEMKAYEILNTLIPTTYSNNFPTVIDWIDGRYKKELNLLLKKTFKNKPELIKDINQLIDKAVDEQIKLLEKVKLEFLQTDKNKKRKMK